MTPKPDATTLDACCGGKMFHFAKDNPDVLFADNRRETLKYDRTPPHGKWITIAPDLLADFRALPFPDARFRVVIFDPPHLVRVGAKSFLSLKYGKLDTDYQTQLRAGFHECFRVLKPHGLLIFKWSEVQIPLSRILPLAPHKPLIGQRCGKNANTHWLIFKKPAPAAQTKIEKPKNP